MSKITSYVYIFYPLDTQSTNTLPTSTSVTSDSHSSSSSNDGDNHVYPGVFVGGLFMFIAGIAIMGIIIKTIKKKKFARLSLCTARGIPQQASLVQLPQATTINQSYNPSYTQQQTAQVSTGEEATVTSVIPQSATHDIFCVATAGSSSNPSALPDDAINFPPYCVEHAPDEATNNQSFSHDGTLTLSSPDYAPVVSAGVSVPVPSVDNI